MDDLIEALTILRKYDNPEFPTNCGHDEMFVQVDPKLVSAEDIQRLADLGFHTGEFGFISYKFGSC